jgi:hypothetical protein
MNEKREYMLCVLDVNGFDFATAEIKLEDSRGHGFFYRLAYEDGGRVYYVYAPAEKDLSYFVELTLRHELGHIILNELWFRDEALALEKVRKIKEGHKIFVRLQRFYYWNPFLRWIKRGLGFSSRIQYGPEDRRYISEAGEITRAEDELFADYFSLGKGGYK